MADEKELAEKYNELKEKYGLPSFEDLEQNFEISSVDDKNILRGIRRKMSEKLEHYAKMLEDYIQPDSSFSSMYEVKDFDDKKRNKVMALFKKVMVLYKEAVKLNLNLGEEKDAQFINDLFSDWKNIKEQLVELIDFTKESWRSKDNFENYQNYLG